MDRQFFVDRIEAGDTKRDLCAATGLTMNKLGMVIKEYGLRMRGGPTPKLPPLSEIKRRLESGEHPRDIAEAFGATTPAVYLAFSREGQKLKELFDIPRRKPGPRSKAERAQEELAA